MASIPSEFEGPDAIVDDVSKSGDEEEVSTGPESAGSGSVGGENGTSNGNGFEPSDDSSITGQDEEESGNGDENSDGREGEVDRADGLESVGGTDENEGEEEERGGNDENVRDGNGQGGLDDEVDPDAIVLLPESQYLLLGITEDEYKTFPRADAISLEVCTVIAVSLLKQVSGSSFNVTTFPLMQRAVEGDFTNWFGYIAGEVLRSLAASGLRLHAFMLEIYSQAILALIEKLAEGDPSCVNIRVALLNNDELVVPFVPRIKAMILSGSVGGGRTALGSMAVNNGM